MDVDTAADTSQMTSEEEETEDEYPPWLAEVAKECPIKVTVLGEEDDNSHSGYIRCKAVQLPDPLDVAENKDPRQYELRRFSTVLVLAGPEEPPYIGLIDKIWRKASARPAGDEADKYFAVDFQVECYWFYRQSELPSTAWTSLRRERKMPAGIRGAEHKLSSKHKPVYESASVRQVLFSSHHTQHDAAEDNPQGWINLSAVLQTCQMHWPGLKGQIPDNYVIHGNKLIRTRQPGYVVQGFLWCNSRNRPQLAPQYKRAFPLDGSWNDQETADIVAVMRKRYQTTVLRSEERNKSIIEEYKRNKLAQQQRQQQPAAAGHTTQRGPTQQVGAGPAQQQQSQRSSPQKDQQPQKQRLKRLQRTGVSSGYDTSSNSEENATLMHRLSKKSKS